MVHRAMAIPGVMKMKEKHNVYVKITQGHTSKFVSRPVVAHVFGKLHVVRLLINHGTYIILMIVFKIGYFCVWIIVKWRNV
jgi:hypothetical protein